MLTAADFQYSTVAVTVAPCYDFAENNAACPMLLLAFVLGFNLQTYSGQTTLKARFVARAAVTLAVCY